MKRHQIRYTYCVIIFIISQFQTVQTQAQYNQKMGYQAVVRDNNNQLLVNSQVRMRVSIMADSVNAVSSYVETHQLTTTMHGLVNMEIGGGAVVSGSFAKIPWSRGKIFLKTEIDPAGGTNYAISGIQQLLSVPYAMSSSDVPVSKNGDTVNIGSSKLIIPGSTLIPGSLTDGLIAYYPFNGNANDESGNGNHGTVNGAILTLDKSDIPNRAFSFNGINTLIDLPLMTILNNKTKLTFSFWVRSPLNFDNPPYRSIFSHWTYTSSPAGPIGIQLGLSSNLYSPPFSVFTSMEGGRAVESESNSVKENTWQHIVIVYNGDEIIESDRLKLYINGIYSGNFPKGDQFTPTQVGTIANRTVLGGAVGLSGGPIWARFIGEIDEFRIYQRNLSQSEISFLASQ